MPIQVKKLRKFEHPQRKKIDLVTIIYVDRNAGETLAPIYCLPTTKHDEVISDYFKRQTLHTYHTADICVTDKNWMIVSDTQYEAIIPRVWVKKRNS